MSGKPFEPGPDARRTGGFRKGDPRINRGGRVKGIERMVREAVGGDFVAIVRAQVSIASGRVPIDADGMEIDLPKIAARDMTSAAAWLLDRGWGKAIAPIRVTGTLSNLTAAALAALSTEELERMLADAESEADEDDADGDDPSEAAH